MEDAGLGPAAFSFMSFVSQKAVVTGLKTLGIHRNFSLQEGGCSVPVAVHTVVKDGQVSRGKWVGRQGRTVAFLPMHSRFLSSTFSEYAEATIFFPPAVLDWRGLESRWLR